MVVVTVRLMDIDSSKTAHVNRRVKFLRVRLSSKFNAVDGDLCGRTHCEKQIRK